MRTRNKRSHENISAVSVVGFIQIAPFGRTFSRCTTYTLLSGSKRKLQKDKGKEEEGIRSG